jgi:hypothetical protein
MVLQLQARRKIIKMEPLLNQINKGKESKVIFNKLNIE